MAVDDPHPRHATPHGELRDQAILATSQQVFPGNIVYRLARRHVRAVGTYFLIEIVLPGDEAPAAADLAKLAKVAPGER